MQDDKSSCLGRCLVTGGSGFIGRYLVRRLVQDRISVASVILDQTGISDLGCDVFAGDIRNPSLAKEATKGCTTVFHLAGKAHDLVAQSDDPEHQSVTVEGTKTLLAAALENGAQRVVFLSSLSVYGTDSDERRDETAPCNPSSAYGRAKLTAEQYILRQGKASGIHVCCLRPAMVYGRGCKGNLPRMIAAIDQGFFPPLPKLNNKRSMVHASDLVHAMILAGTTLAANGQIYIVTDNRSYSTRQLYEAISHSLRKRVPSWGIPLEVFKAIARIGDVVGQARGRRFLFDSDALVKLTGSAWFSSEKITRELGYQPKVAFEDALPEMIAWYRETQARQTC